MYENSGKIRYSCATLFPFIAPQGIAACDVTSEGYKHLHAATAVVLGESKPYSTCGGLPLIGDLQKADFDIQVCAYKYCIAEFCTIATCM